MSAAEYYRYNGTLTSEHIEDLLSIEARLEQVKGIDAYIGEAMAQFPAEDFLSDVENRLQELCKRLRGDNRETLKDIIESLSNVAQCEFNSTNYGRDELRKARVAISNIYHKSSQKVGRRRSIG